MDIRHIDHNQLNMLPMFGASASFSSLYESITMGDNHSQRFIKGINGLSMNLKMAFTELNDIEAQQLISFLQSKLYYEPQAYDSKGHFSNKRIETFLYQPFLPYKQNRFICLSFEHNKQHLNCNNVTANFLAVAPSILNSVESGAGHNSTIDSTLTLQNNRTNFSVSDNNVNLPKGSIIYHPNSYIYGVVQEDFTCNKDNSQDINFSSNQEFSDGEEFSSNQTPLRNSIYIDNPNDCFYYPYEPSTSSQNLKHRMFDFRPSSQTAITHSPKHKKSTVTDHYIKYNKYGFNANLSNLSVSFSGRSDLEAKRILLFLESHLGYKMFGFHFQKDYSNALGENNRSPHRKKLSYFYCPEWNHEFIYKDNHTINATFIECLPY